MNSTQPATLSLGMIGNSRIAALIDAQASIVWWCHPRPDAGPVCDALVAGAQRREHGWIDTALEDFARASQTYERNTAVLRTMLEDSRGGAIEVIDFAPRFNQYDRLFNPASVVRIVRRLRGHPRIALRVRPSGPLGERAEAVYGANHVGYRCAGFTLRLTTDAPVTMLQEERFFRLGGDLTLVFGADETLGDAPGAVGQRFLAQTTDYWRNWVRNLAVPLDWQDVVIRAAITLKLNAFDDTGAVLAAVTTSIPEAPDSGRTWDYRFCWMRDAYFVVNGLNRLGATGTMRRYLGYIYNLVAEADVNALQPVYGLSGAATLTESISPVLQGYRGMGPVRIGNDAYRQVQNDVYGELVLAATHSFFDQRLDHPADVAAFESLEPLGEAAVARWDTPDAGLWELRGTQQVHTFSSVMCWAAADRLARVAAHLGLSARFEYWRAHAGRIHAGICAAAWNADLQAFVSTFGGTDLDASLLLLAELQFLTPEDPRFASTVRAIEKRLKRGDFLLRYDVQDDFGLPETAFLVCSLWWVLALTQLGELDPARALFEKILAIRTPLGLLAEDVDPRTGELWGNFPQTYSMVGLIQCAMRLSRSWDDAY